MESVRSNGTRKQRTVASRNGAAKRKIKQSPRPADPDAYTIELEQQLEQLLKGLRAASAGKLDVRIPTDGRSDLPSQVARAFNELVERGHDVTKEIERINDVVGRQGRVTVQAAVPHAAGSWGTCIESLNALTAFVGWRTQELARIINDVAQGDLSQKMALEFEGNQLRGAHLNVASAVNQLVDRLRIVSSEVNRVSREVGAEGKLGGQADAPGVSGTWKELTDNVNLLAGNLTNQVRNIALVTTAVAKGDL
jgi:methyl-accepting chemotaxis protein